MVKIKKNLSFILLILICVIFKSISIDLFENNLQLPIVKLALNGQNLGEIEKILVTKILSEKEFILPESNISENIAFIGNINLSFYNMILTLSNKTDFNLSFIEEDNLNININELKGKIAFDYIFNSNFINGEGNGTIFINNMKLIIKNNLIQVPNTHEPEKNIPGIQIDEIKIEDLELEIFFSKNGTFEKLVKYVNNNLKNLLLNVLEIELNKEEGIKNINNNLLEVFKNIDLNVPFNLTDIDDNLYFSFSINEKPIIKNQYLEISLEGEIKGNHYIYDEINNISLPCIVNNKDLISNKSINSIISQFIINNALDVLYYFGKLNYEITNNTINFTINVNIISGIIPEIISNTSDYNKTQKVKIITNVISSPKLSINNGNIIKLLLNVNLKIFVYNDTTYLKDNIGTIPIDSNSLIEIIADFSINNGEILLKIKSIQMLTFDVQKSLIGDINSQRVITRFNNTIKAYILTINNSIKKLIDDLKQKIINYEGINFSDINTKSYEKYIKVDISPILVPIFNLYYS